MLRTVQATMVSIVSPASVASGSQLTMFSATVQAFANAVVYVATFSMRAHRHCVTVTARAVGCSLLCTAIALRAALCLQVLDCGLFGNEKRDGHVGGADLE